jgi:hypothetical protein
MSSPAFTVRSRAVRYCSLPPQKRSGRLSRQDVHSLTRLYETGDAAHLVLHFGEHRGATLLQVAEMDQDYVQLALTAQRPEVRAAARQLVIALEHVAARSGKPARQVGGRGRPGRFAPPDDPRCPRCLEFAEQLEQLQQRLSATGQFIAYSPGPNPNPDLERELSRWLAVNPRADAAAGFRAGWARLARFYEIQAGRVGEHWWRMARENDRLKAFV